jgi:formylglycine-generating enzyme required for sulfatase activity
MRPASRRAALSSGNTMRIYPTAQTAMKLARLAGALVIAGACLGGIGSALSTTTEPGQPDVVNLEPGTFVYRVAGEFTQAGRPVNAPLVNVRIGYPLAIMRTQVSAADFDRCVADGACRPREAAAGRPDLPAVGVNWIDAAAYARWLSAKTGQRWRLPTDEEWAFAAGSRFKDDAIASATGPDPSQRWLAKYDQEASRKGNSESSPRPFGTYGVNEQGLLDVAGNVWEWTETCFSRQALDAAGHPAQAATTNCGVRVAAGQHRSYVSDFIRDPRAGGCSVGLPPTNLGFRLVRQAPAGNLSRLLAQLRGGAADSSPNQPWHKWPRLD